MKHGLFLNNNSISTYGLTVYRQKNLFYLCFLIQNIDFLHNNSINIQRLKVYRLNIYFTYAV